MIYLLFFEIVDKIFIKFMLHFSNNYKIELIICLNVFFSLKLSKIELFKIGNNF